MYRDHSNFVNCVRYSPDGSKFVSVSSDKRGIIFDGKSGEKIGELSSEGGHTGSIYAVSWSPDGKQVSILLSILLIMAKSLDVLIPFSRLSLSISFSVHDFDHLTLFSFKS